MAAIIHWISADVGDLKRAETTATDGVRAPDRGGAVSLGEYKKCQCPLLILRSRSCPLSTLRSRPCPLSPTSSIPLSLVTRVKIGASRLVEFTSLGPYGQIEPVLTSSDLKMSDEVNYPQF